MWLIQSRLDKKQDPPFAAIAARPALRLAAVVALAVLLAAPGLAQSTEPTPTESPTPPPTGDGSAEDGNRTPETGTDPSFGQDLSQEEQQRPTEAFSPPKDGEGSLLPWVESMGDSTFFGVPLEIWAVLAGVLLLLLVLRLLGRRRRRRKAAARRAAPRGAPPKAGQLPPTPQDETWHPVSPAQEPVHGTRQKPEPQARQPERRKTRRSRPDVAPDEALPPLPPPIPLPAVPPPVAPPVPVPTPARQDRMRMPEEMAVAEEAWEEVAPAGSPKASPEPGRVANVFFLDDQGRPVPPTQALVVDTPYLLHLDIGLLDPHSIVEDPVPVPSDLLPPREEGHWLEVFVASASLRVPSGTRWMFLPRKGPAWLCPCAPGGSHRCQPEERHTDLDLQVRTPPRPGEADARLALYYEGNLVQSQLVTATVAAQAGQDGRLASRIDYTLAERLQDLGRLPPRQLHILANENTDGTHRIIVNQRSGDPFAVSLSEAQAIEALSWTRDALRGLRMAQRTLRPGDGLPDDFEKELRRMAELGSQLFAQVFGGVPGQARSVLKALAAPATIQVARIRGSTFAYPWAFVYEFPFEPDASHKPCPVLSAWTEVGARLGDDVQVCPMAHAHGPNTLCPFGFWGFRHTIEQPASHSQLPVTMPLQREAPEAVVCWNLELSRDGHWTRLQQAMRGFRFRECTTRDGLRDALADPDLELVYFYCHGRRGGPEELGKPLPYLEVGAKERLQPTHITQWSANWWTGDGHWKTTAPLVFINGCHTAEVSPQSFVNFVDAFHGAGAAGVVGTEISVLQSTAEHAAEVFLASFPRESVGVALRRVRLSFLRSGSLMGLAYTAYCSIDLTYTRTNP